MAWQRVASVADVAADKGLQVKIGAMEVAIFRVGETPPSRRYARMPRRISPKDSIDDDRVSGPA